MEHLSSPLNHGTDLPDGCVLRSATARDLMSIRRLLFSSRWSYRPLGSRDLEILLAEGIGTVCTRHGLLRGFCLCDTYRAPVVACGALALRRGLDAAEVFAGLLAHIEDALFVKGMRWLSFDDRAPWLLDWLNRHGYARCTRVLYYDLDHCDTARLVPLVASGTCIAVGAVLPSELEEVEALDHRAFEPFWRVNAAILQDAYDRSSYFLVARHDRQVVGYIIAGQTANRAHISRLGVAPAWQRQSVGSRLLRALMTLARREGICGLMLNTQEDNAASRAFYEGHGFRLTDERIDFWAKALGEIPAENCDALLTCP